MFRYKDRAPSETVTSVKKILAQAGISVLEQWFDSKVANAYSLRVSIVDTDYGANGKGVTKELARASAYGELIERLGSGIICKHGERKRTADVGFVFMPDEKMLSQEYYESEANGKIVRSILGPFADGPDLGLENWKRMDGDLIGIPFYNEITAEQEYVPNTMLRVYGSNGMAAGNSKSEAFVQAVSEIFERYCLQTIIRQKLTPPIISRAYIQNKYPLIDKMLSSIESNPNITVIVRYCAAQTGFPVIAVCLYDKVKHSDLISFGAHPVEEIAMERAITELFQGRDIDDISNLITERKREQRYNILSVLKNGIGYFPVEFHMTNAQEIYEPTQGIEFASNREAKQYILELCKKGNRDVFSRYLKIGDMYIVHVIIPGMSEVYNYDSLQFNCLEMQKHVKNMLNGNLNHDLEIFQTCLEFVDFSRKTPEMDVNLSKGFRLGNDFTKQRDSLSLLASGFFRLKQFDRALQYIGLLKKYLPLDLCMCMQSITEMERDGYKNFIDHLKLYFDDGLISDGQRMLDYDYVVKQIRKNVKEGGHFINKSWLDSIRSIKEMIEAI